VHGYNDWRIWALATAVCSEGDTMVEIGANVGTETVGFRDLVGCSGRVFAFEPLPSNLDALRNLSVLNGWDNVHILPHALGETDARVTFALPPGKHASGVGHLVLGNAVGTTRTIEVQCRTLDSLANQIGTAKAIFCDAEGAETTILRGAREFLARHKSVFVVEASPKLLVRAGSNLCELHQTVQSLGYQAFVVGRFGLRPVADLIQVTTRNWFCVHGSMSDLAWRASFAIARCGLMPCLRGLNPLCK
jgi:FkbM family methyltransferase